MAEFQILEIVCFYDGVQLMLVGECDRLGNCTEKTYIATHSLDEGVFLATRLSDKQLQDFKNSLSDVKTLMTHPCGGDMYILVHSHLCSNYIQRSSIHGFYGFSVDVFNPVFFDWVIPEAGCYYGDY